MRGGQSEGSSGLRLRQRFDTRRGGDSGWEERR